MENEIIDATIDAMKLIVHKRFFQTERGYQGAFCSSLEKELDKRKILNDEIILEMEYQKSERHGMSQRPDIVLHVPTDKIHVLSKNVGNYAVFAFKHQASKKDAIEDFDKLDEMFWKLDYQLGIFISVNSNNHCLEFYNGRYKSKIHCFGVWLENNTVKITRAYWENDKELKTGLLN